MSPAGPGPIPVHLQIDFLKADIDAERVARDLHRRDAFDGGKLWAAIQARIDARLEDLFLLMLERDGITVPDEIPEPA